MNLRVLIFVFDLIVPLLTSYVLIRFKFKSLILSSFGFSSGSTAAKMYFFDRLRVEILRMPHDAARFRATSFLDER